MGTLPRTYVDHLVSPRTTRDLEEAHAGGEAGSMVGGLGLRVTLRWGAGDVGTSQLVAFGGRTFGSPAPVAPLSWMAEHLVGQRRAAVSALEASTVLEALGDGDARRLPDRVALAAELAVGALRKALGEPDAGAPADLEGPGLLVCRCLGVGDREIRQAIAGGAQDPERIGEICRASTGCRSCRPDLLRLVDDECEEPWPAPADGASDVEQVTWACGGPLLRSLGYDLQRVVMNGEAVHVAARPIPDQTPQTTHLGSLALLRFLLRDIVDDDIRVEALEGA